MSSPSVKTNLKETFGVAESIDALAESNPELYEAIRTIEVLDTKLYETIKSHFSGALRPSEDLPTPTALEEGTSRRSSKISTFFRGQSRRFSLDTLPPTVAEIMALFDFDGDGKVTLDEVRQGAQELRESKKKNKIAIWAMIIQFLVYTALTAGSCGVLYHFLYLMKDTTVDPSTGSLMVKDGEDNDVEVSVKSRGETFSYDTTVFDDITGMEKGCVSGSQAAKMFEHVLEGTTLKFVEEDIITGTVNVISVGTNSSVWSDTIMDLGGLVLVPDADCSKALLDEEESNEGNRFLAVQDVYDAHIVSRVKFMHQHFGSTTMARRLEKLKSYGKKIDFDMMAYTLKGKNYTKAPWEVPSSVPTSDPKWYKTTSSVPTSDPKWYETPVQAPWKDQTSYPVQAPWKDPSSYPVQAPWKDPSSYPVQAPWKDPSSYPVQAPWKDPSSYPVQAPWKDPSSYPVQAPWKDPSSYPVQAPWKDPSSYPVQAPWKDPSSYPVQAPWKDPSSYPVQAPWKDPSSYPVQAPWKDPSSYPVQAPWKDPSSYPVQAPWKDQTSYPVKAPWKDPSSAPVEWKVPPSSAPVEWKVPPSSAPVEWKVPPSSAPVEYKEKEPEQVENKKQIPDIDDEKKYTDNDD